MNYMITKKFKKIIYMRNPRHTDEIPNRKEIELFLLECLGKGYIILENSMTIRNINTPENGENYKIWAWFVYVGKRKAQKLMSYNKDNKNFQENAAIIFYPEIYAFSKESINLLKFVDIINYQEYMLKR